MRKLGEGGRSTVYLGYWHDRDVALKIYKQSAIERHARRHPLNINEFEYQRNKALYQVPGLSRYIAEPLSLVEDEEHCGIIQERLFGSLYYFYYRDRDGEVTPDFKIHLARIIELAHGANLYDVDIQAFNVIVDESSGEPIPKLFDFNLIPFHERSGNPLLKLFLKLGIMRKSARDLRLLRNFNKVARQGKKSVRYFESE